MRITSNGHQTKIAFTANEADYDLVKYAAETLGFVNGIRYDCDGQQWADNIKAVYDENNPRIKVILSLITTI